MKHLKTYENLNQEPVITYYSSNGQKQYEEYYLNGKWHREDGPAIQSWWENGQKESEFYYLNGKRHREDGPAYQGWYENGQKESEIYYLNYNSYSRENWLNELKKINSPHYEDQLMKYEA